MIKAAKIVNGFIVQILAVDTMDEISAYGGEWVDVTGMAVGVGWNWTGTTATPPEEIQPKIPLQAKIKDAEKLAQRVALRQQVDSSLDSLTDEEISTITYLYDEWSGDGKLLKADVKVRYQGILYRVISQHNTQADWNPAATPALFTPFRDPAAGPSAWVQPTGAQDAYNTGERVYHDNPNDAGNLWVYESSIDANTTEPGRDGTFDRYWTPIELYTG